MLLQVPDAADTCTSKWKPTKGNQLKVKRKCRLQKEVREDEISGKRVMIERDDIQKNERQEADVQKFLEGRPVITV